MVVDFSKLNLKERQTLILKNQDGTYIQPLVFAHNLEAKLYYNEVSEITFDVPALVDGKKTPHYDDVVGMRLIDWIGVGQFILVNPKTKHDGVSEIKSCTAYSLEYELTYKNIYIQNGTYKFWDPVSPKNTVLGMILELLPSWHVGSVDLDLADRYRTFDVSNQSVYEFIKGQIQETYQCVFDFDTRNRSINARSVSSIVNVQPIYLSMENLIKEVEIDEDTENIVTCVDVNGAEGVDIRSVNPMGTNELYNLDYFMNETYFPKSIESTKNIIDNWLRWKAYYEESKVNYFNLTIQKVLKESELEGAKAELASQEGKLSSLETLQSAYISGAATSSSLASKLPEIKADINEQKKIIKAQKDLIESIEGQIDIFYQKQKEINERCSFESFFDPSEMLILDRYIKKAAITEESFIYKEVDSYDQKDIYGDSANASLAFIGCNASMSHIADGGIDGSAIDVHRLSGGYISLLSNDTLCYAEMIDAVIKESDDGNILATIRLGTGYRTQKYTDYVLPDGSKFGYVAESENDKNAFSSACLTVSGPKCSIDYSDIEDKTNCLCLIGKKILAEHIFELESAQSVECIDVHDRSNAADMTICEIIAGRSYNVTFRGATESTTAIIEARKKENGVAFSHNGVMVREGNIAVTNTLDVNCGFSIFEVVESDVRIYFTVNTTEFSKRSVEWELMEYGYQCLEELCWPKYNFSIDAGNFLALDDFEYFKGKLELGSKIYLNIKNTNLPTRSAISDGQILTPIVIGIEFSCDKPDDFKILFGDKYSLKDSAFQLVDLLKESVNMGKTVASNKTSYNSFKESGAHTQVKSFMESALNAAKNAVLAGENQSFLMDGSGFRMRKWNEEAQDYDPQQIWMVNNNIVFTDDNWQTAKMAFGHLKDDTIDAWGLVADMLIGKMLVGSDLSIEARKTDANGNNTESVTFRVDGSGAVLHNARFDVIKGDSQISIYPEIGLVASECSGDDLYVYDKSHNIIGIRTRKGDDPMTEISDKINYENLPNANFWIDTKGNVFLKGRIYADDGYFQGEVHADSGVFEGAVYANEGEFNGTVNVQRLLIEGTDVTSLFKAIQNANNGELDHLEIGNMNVDGEGNITWKVPLLLYEYSKDKERWHELDEEDKDKAFDMGYQYVRTSADGGVTWVIERLLPDYITRTQITSTTIESPTIKGNYVQAYGAFEVLSGGDGKYGYMGAAKGMDKVGNITYGVAISADGTREDKITYASQGHYVIATTAGCRMQATPDGATQGNSVVVTDNSVTLSYNGTKGENAIQINSDGCKYRINGGSWGDLGQVVLSDEVKVTAVWG